MKLEEVSRLSLAIPEPFDFRLTVAKPAGWHWSSPAEIFADGTLWSGLYLDSRPVGLRMSARTGGVSAIVYARSALSSAELHRLEEVLKDGLGADEDLAAFYDFARHDPILSVTVKDLYGMRAARLDDTFGRVLLAILLQMAPVARSREMMDGVLRDYGLKISFDNKDVVLWPRPEVIVRAGEAELRARAMVGYRARRLVQAAGFLAEHPVSLLALRDLPEGEAVRRLTAIPGIGEYSAGIILGRSLVPVDVWSVVIMSELVLGRTPENPRAEIDAVAAELRARWGEWGWLAFVYILNDLEKLSQTIKLSRLH